VAQRYASISGSFSAPSPRMYGMCAPTSLRVIPYRLSTIRICGLHHILLQRATLSRVGSPASSPELSAYAATIGIAGDYIYRSIATSGGYLAHLVSTRVMPLRKRGVRCGKLPMRKMAIAVHAGAGQVGFSLLIVSVLGEMFLAQR